MDRAQSLNPRGMQAALRDSRNNNVGRSPYAPNNNVHIMERAPLSSTVAMELRQQGFPGGLAEQLWDTKHICPIRFWIVDNSGSMKCPDGRYFRFNQNNKDNVIVVSCTRWQELQNAVEYHAKLAGTLHLKTVFRMLNGSGRPGVSGEFEVANKGANIQQDIASAQANIRMTQPDGVTPLTSHIIAIRDRIEKVRHLLEENEQKAVVVIATDGIPSDKYGNSTPGVKEEFLAALKSLQTLPVWLVVRLCTDDQACSNFYNSLDLNLELPLEVLDDIVSEAREVNNHNDWLNYAIPLHRCREMGYRHHVLDLLDERVLNKDEVKELLELLFGKQSFENAPNVHDDFKGFMKIVTNINKSEEKQWNPLTNKMERWLDVKKLERAFKPKGRMGLFRKSASARKAV